MYGLDICNLTCNCIHENSLGCDSISGLCKCKQGWGHKDCSQAICKNSDCKYECIVTSTNPWLEECFCPKRMRTVTNSSGFYCTEQHECNSDVRETSGYLSNPPYPIIFPGCHWRIITEPGSVISLSFSMEVNPWSFYCEHNYITITDEETEDQPTVQMCAATRGEIQTSSNVMRIVFHGYILNYDTLIFSGRYNVHACPKFKWGFNNCEYECSCIKANTKYCDTKNGRCICKDGFTSHDCSFGTVPSTACGTLNERNGYLHLDNNNICWIIHGVDILFHSDYMWDRPSEFHLDIYDGNNNASPRLGGELDTLFKASGKEMYLEVSMESVDVFYPTLSFTMQPSLCGGTMFSSSGYISSPQYSKKYPDYSDCRWTIVAKENFFISLRINDLKLEQHTTCDNDYLDIYNGSSDTAVRIGHFCNGPVPTIINSTSNFMYIVFHSDQSISDRGFHADFQAIECPHHWTKGGIAFCSCEKTHTLYCDINTGECVCKPGWTGYNCEMKVDLCSSNSCPDNTTCETEDGSISCRSCNVHLTSESGYLWSPGNARSCFWEINGPTFSVVTLSFQEYTFSAPFISARFMPEVYIYNVNSSHHTLLGKYFKKSTPGIVRSTGESMRVVLENYYLFINGFSFRASFSTHVCNPFTYGLTCQNQCNCEINNTLFCDNLTGLCICKEQWFGERCTEKRNPCLLQDITFKCPKDTICINKDDAYSCVCRQGYVMNANDQCEVQERCLKIHELCSHSCVINEFGKEECTCPHNMVLGGDHVTCVVPFYPNGPNARDKKLSTNEKFISNGIYFEELNLEVGIPYGSQLYNTLYVMANGVVSFDTSVLPKEPSLAVAKKLKMNLIAPFWTKISQLKGSVWYNVYNRCGDHLHSGKSQTQGQVFSRAVHDVKNLFHLGNFDIQTVIVITWNDISPEVTEGNETITFQMIIVSGYNSQQDLPQDTYQVAETSYALMIYRKDQMHWTDKLGRAIEVGYTIGDERSYALKEDFENLLRTLPEHSLENTGPRGVWAYDVGSVSSAAEKCQRYMCHHSALISNAKYQSDIRELHRCPCSVERKGRQWETIMYKNGYSYYSLTTAAMSVLFPNNDRNKICSYKYSSGNYYITKSPFAGHILISRDSYSEDNELNLMSHDWCCVESNKSALCDNFYTIFPDMGCSNIVSFISGAALGDPHFTTLDNLNYTMNGWGEYILMNVSSRNFMLQSRTEVVKDKNGTFSKATAFVAFAAKEGDTPTFQVQLSPDKSRMVISANNKDITKDFYDSLNYTMNTDTFYIKRGNTQNRCQIVTSFASGTALVIEVGVESLNLNIEVEKSLRYLTRGLLGNFNGNPDDDFQLPNGTVLFSNLTEEDILYTFASAYRVTEENSIFIYDEGKSFDDYQHPEFTPTFSRSFTSSEINEAAELCGDMTNDCIFDFISTHDDTFALNTKFLKEEVDAKRANLANNPPMLEIAENKNIINTRWFVVESNVNTLQLNATDEDSDSITLILLENKSNNIQLHQNGTLCYIPNTQEPAIIGIQAKDSKNASSSIIYIPITVYPTCNGRGGFQNNLISNREYLNGQFTILQCFCLPAYTGLNCEFELDACETMPCATGQNCTDLTAQEQGNLTMGYHCGPCPKGFVEVDLNCLDINECYNGSLCSQDCVNTEGSYYCQCDHGFVLSASDNSSCIDFTSSTCHCILENTYSFLETTGHCVCKEGWTGKNCSIKFDNCYNHSCPDHLQCQERKVGYACLCLNGLKVGPAGNCHDCNRTLYNFNGWIMSSNYPLEYENDLLCTWTIISPEPNTIITLSITEFEVEGCPYDSLKIFEGNSTSDNFFGPFCNSAPGVLKTGKGAFHIVFQTDFSVTRKGFRGFYSIEGVCLFKKCSDSCQVMSFSPRVEICTCPDWKTIDTFNASRCIDINSCNTTVTSTGPIVTPLFPNLYSENVKCFWNISRGNNSEINISFSDFEIEERWDCGYDSVEFLEGPDAKSLGKFCGGMAPTITSREHFLVVVFISDNSVSGRGFKGKVTIT